MSLRCKITTNAMGKSTGKLFGDLVLQNIFYIAIIIEYLE